MGDWLTVAELQLQYGEARINRLADRDNDGSADAGVIDAAIASAEGAGKAKLTRRFQLSDLPAVATAASAALKDATAGLAFYELHKGLDNVGDMALREQADAERWFNDAARGDLSLLLAGAPPVDSSRMTVATVRRSSQVGEMDKPISIGNMGSFGSTNPSGIR